MSGQANASKGSFRRSPSSALLPFLGEGFPTTIDYRRKGTLILTSLLEDLVSQGLYIRLVNLLDFPPPPESVLADSTLKLAAWLGGSPR